MTPSATQLLQRLEAVIHANRHIAEVHEDSHPFAALDCIEIPSISIREFLDLLCVRLSRWELGVAFVLADRLTKRCSVPVSPISAHRLMLTAIIISVKLQRDTAVVAHYSSVTGLSAGDLRRMEAAFLRLLDFEVHVEREEVESMMMVIKQQRELADDGDIGFVPLVPCTTPAATPPVTPRPRSGNVRLVQCTPLASPLATPLATPPITPRPRRIPSVFLKAAQFLRSWDAKSSSSKSSSLSATPPSKMAVAA